MKEIIIALALVVGFNTNAQTTNLSNVLDVGKPTISIPNVVFTNGGFTINDAVTAAGMYGADYALSNYYTQQSFVIYSNGKINRKYDLGNLENVLQFLNNIKNGVSTEMYTVEPYYFGSKVVTFKGSDTKYYITPYLRRLATKAVKSYLITQV